MRRERYETPCPFGSVICSRADAVIAAAGIGGRARAHSRIEPVPEVRYPSQSLSSMFSTAAAIDSLPIWYAMYSAPAGVRKPDIIHVQHAHRKRNLGADRIQLRIE